MVKVRRKEQGYGKDPGQQVPMGSTSLFYQEKGWNFPVGPRLQRGQQVDRARSLPDA